MFTFISKSASGNLSWWPILTFSFSVLLALWSSYLSQILTLIGTCYSIRKLRKHMLKEEYKWSDMCVVPLFIFHIAGHMFLQVLMTTSIGVAYHSEVKFYQQWEMSNVVVPGPSPMLWYQIGIAFLEPVFGTIIFCVLYYYWILQFFIQHSTDVIKQLKYKGLLDPEEERTCEELCRYSEKFKSEKFSKKACIPFSVPCFGVLCAIYLLLLVTAIFFNLTIETSTLQFAIFIFACVLNLYAFIIGFVYILIYVLLVLFCICSCLSSD